MERAKYKEDPRKNKEDPRKNKEDFANYKDIKI